MTASMQYKLMSSSLYHQTYLRLSRHWISPAAWLNTLPALVTLGLTKSCSGLGRLAPGPLWVGVGGGLVACWFLSLGFSLGPVTALHIYCCCCFGVVDLCEEQAIYRLTIYCITTITYYFVLAQIVNIIYKHLFLMFNEHIHIILIRLGSQIICWVFLNFYIKNCQKPRKSLQKTATLQY